MPVPRYSQGIATGPFRPFSADAAGGQDTKLSQFSSFTTGFDSQTVLFSNLDKASGKLLHLSGENWTKHAGAVQGPEFGIAVQKADDALLSVGRQPLTVRGKLSEMPLDGKGLVDDDRIITPDNKLPAYSPAQLDKGICQFGLIRQAWLQLWRIGSEGKLEIVAVPQTVNLIQPLCQIPGIFGPEDNAVNVRGRERNSVDLSGIYGIAGKNFSRLQSTDQPLGVVMGNISSSAGAQNQGKHLPCIEE